MCLRPVSNVKFAFYTVLLYFEEKFIFFQNKTYMHRILLIEDDDFDSFVIGDFLERNNFEVTVTENGLMGINFAKQEKPDLILCEINAPVLDGYEVIEALRYDASTCYIPLLFIAALDDPESRMRAKELGVNDYLIKPIDLDELLIKVNQHLQ